MNKKNKINWENGASEMMAFLLTFPFVVMSLCLVMYEFQATLIHQRAQITSYSATRAAALQTTSKSAEYVGSVITEEQHGDKGEFSISYVKGSSWDKGNIIEGTVKVKYDTLIPFVSGSNEATAKATTNMMIERN